MPRLSLLLAAPALAEPPRHEATDLGTPGGEASRAYAVAGSMLWERRRTRMA